MASLHSLSAALVTVMVRQGDNDTQSNGTMEG